MKRILILSMLISFAMICSCQKQDSTAEQQLAQRKTELDAREDALIEREKVAEEREKVLDEREKALAENEKAAIPPAQSSDTIPDPAQAKAERDRKIQEIAAQFRAMIPDSSKLKARDPAKRERPAPRQLGPEDLQRQWRQNLDKAKMSGKALFPAAEATSPTSSPAVEAASPTSSPTPESIPRR